LSANGEQNSAFPRLPCQNAALHACPIIPFADQFCREDKAQTVLKHGKTKSTNAGLICERNPE